MFIDNGPVEIFSSCIFSYFIIIAVPQMRVYHRYISNESIDIYVANPSNLVTVGTRV